MKKMALGRTELDVYLLLSEFRLRHANSHVLVGALNCRLGCRSGRRSRSQALLLRLDDGFCSRLVGQSIFSRAQQLFDLILGQIRYRLCHGERCGGLERGVSWEIPRAKKCWCEVISAYYQSTRTFFFFDLDGPQVGRAVQNLQGWLGVSNAGPNARQLVNLCD